ncbi:hypothetical protein [Marinobacterium sediminicola]|uniref:Tripartite ATP-independent transporter DctQ subunit n=1 Tax=Marinobacterium sediminicola TaxID=518898 RepID=A0ABY1S2Z6_9GAMM|nr:hypothetical protein [Marinobacterium sediminicola]ULG68474.1 hypothetical protein LN244_12305 [Marinobacterium sediminicola]SMR76758.1 hypothetical protein SAMN04487964_11286 [Marinobacterium sediminicola]
MNMFSARGIVIATVLYLGILAGVIVNGSGWAALADAKIVWGFLAYGWPFLLPMALVLIPLVALLAEGCCTLFEQEETS